MFKLKQKEGFSIVEIMVSVSIVIVGILGVLSLALRNIQVQSFNKSNLIASQLAQEGVELVRNMRDEVWMGSGNTFLDGDKTFTAYFNQTNIVVKNVSSINDDDARLFLNSNNFYVHDGSGGATFSGFRRLIQIKKYSVGVSRGVVSTVSWNDRGQNHSYVIETELYEWKQ